MSKDESEDMVFKSDLEFRRGLVIHTTLQDAQDLVYRLLAESPNGYFTWTSLDDSRVWWLRSPRPGSKEVKMWMNGDQTHIIHICDPIRYVEYAKKGEFRSLVSYSGYADDQSACHQCKQTVPAAIREQAERMKRMINFTSKFDEV